MTYREQYVAQGPHYARPFVKCEGCLFQSSLPENAKGFWFVNEYASHLLCVSRHTARCRIVSRRQISSLRALFYILKYFFFETIVLAYLHFTQLLACLSSKIKLNPMVKVFWKCNRRTDPDQRFGTVLRPLVCIPRGSWKRGFEGRTRVSRNHDLRFTICGGFFSYELLSRFTKTRHSDGN